MNTILKLIDAVKAGNELSNSETWKNRQSASALVMAVLAAVVAVAGVFGYRPDIDPADLSALAGGVVSAFGMFNAYLSLATSSRVGLGAKELQAAPEPESAAGNVTQGGTAPSPAGNTATFQLPSDNGM